MTFKPLNSTQIASGRADDQYLFDLARRNFSDHETRLLNLEGGHFVVGSTVTSDSTTSQKTLASVKITTTGRPVLILLCATNAAGGGVAYAENTSAAQAVVDTNWRIEREDYDPSPNLVEAIRNWRIGHTNAANGTFKFGIPCSVFCCINIPAAGTFVYNFVGNTAGQTNMRAGVENVALCAIELR